VLRALVRTALNSDLSHVETVYFPKIYICIRSYSISYGNRPIGCYSKRERPYKAEISSNHRCVTVYETSAASRKITSLVDSCFRRSRKYIASSVLETSPGILIRRFGGPHCSSFDADDSGAFYCCRSCVTISLGIDTRKLSMNGFTS